MTCRILLDCDGVVCDFQSGVLPIANAIAGTNYKLEDILQWQMFNLPGIKPFKKKIYAAINQPRFIENLPIYAGALEGVELLRSVGEIYMLTAPMRSPTWAHERTRWARKMLGIPEHNVIIASCKEMVEGHVLVDDKVENIKNWILRHGTKKRTLGVIWNQIYNQDEGCHPKVIRISDWQALTSIIETRVNYREQTQMSLLGAL